MLHSARHCAQCVSLPASVIFFSVQHQCCPRLHQRPQHSSSKCHTPNAAGSEPWVAPCPPASHPTHNTGQQPDAALYKACHQLPPFQFSFQFSLSHQPLGLGLQDHPRSSIKTALPQPPQNTMITQTPGPRPKDFENIQLCRGQPNTATQQGAAQLTAQKKHPAIDQVSGPVATPGRAQQIRTAEQQPAAALTTAPRSRRSWPTCAASLLSGASRS